MTTPEQSRAENLSIEQIKEVIQILPQSQKELSETGLPEKIVKPISDILFLCEILAKQLLALHPEIGSERRAVDIKELSAMYPLESKTDQEIISLHAQTVVCAASKIYDDVEDALLTKREHELYYELIRRLSARSFAESHASQSVVGEELEAVAKKITSKHYLSFLQDSNRPVERDSRGIITNPSDKIQVHHSNTL